MDIGTKLFTEFWHLVGHRKELVNHGDYLKVSSPIGDVVLFNDNGEVVAFDNKCPHRGAYIYSGRCGNQPNLCSYHGWTYNFGRLNIPNRESFVGCQIDTADLNKYHIEWCGDFVFVSVQPKISIDDQLDGVREILEDVSFNINGRLDFNFYDYESYWPLSLENALEPYHIAMVHPNTLGALNLGDGVNEFYPYSSIWRTVIGNQRADKSLDKIGSFFNIDYQHKGYMSIYMFPFTMISSTYGFSYSLQNFMPHPDEAEKTYFHSRLLSCVTKPGSAEQVVASFLDSSAKVNRQVFEEDHEVCKLMPKSSWTKEPLVYPSVLEEKIDHFRSLCRKHS